MDKQFAFAVVLLLLGFGLIQLKQDDGLFLAGVGFGTIVIASIWIIIRIVKDFRKK